MFIGSKVTSSEVIVSKVLGFKAISSTVIGSKVIGSRVERIDGYLAESIQAKQLTANLLCARRAMTPLHYTNRLF